MTIAALVFALAQACPGAGPWCGVDVPCRSASHGRDAQGVEHVEIEESLPDSLPVDRAAALWLVYPGFEPFPAQVGTFRHEVGTPRGTFELCLLPSVAARQRRPAGQALEGGLVLLRFEPSRTQEPRFPLDPVFDTARTEGLLTAGQLGSLDELHRIASRRVEDLLRAWRELGESPYLAYSRRQLLDRIRGFDDPLPVLSKDDLRPERFFDRAQRPALRRRGHAIPGRCSLLFQERGTRVELVACPLSQLAGVWNRRTVAKDTLPDLRALPERESEEIERLSLELDGVPPAAGTRFVFGLLSAMEGLAAAETAGP
jgi:hypothetical protein